jgi:monoamine oxidase
VAGHAARAFEQFVDQDWCAERWTRGCPVGLMTCGTMTSYADVWRAPTGRVHWAGTETATVWHGFLEGAIESGERAAREALNAIQ